MTLKRQPAAIVSAVLGVVLAVVQLISVIKPGWGAVITLFLTGLAGKAIHDQVWAPDSHDAAVKDAADSAYLDGIGARGAQHRDTLEEWPPKDSGATNCNVTLVVVLAVVLVLIVLFV